MNKFSVARYRSALLDEWPEISTDGQIYAISTIAMHLCCSWIRNLYAIKDCFRDTRVRMKMWLQQPSIKTSLVKILHYVYKSRSPLYKGQYFIPLIIL